MKSVTKNMKLRLKSLAIVNIFLFALAIGLPIVSLTSCGSGNDEKKTEGTEGKGDEKGGKTAATEDDGKGIGPVKSVEVGALDDAKAEAGNKLFQAKCVSCHKLTDAKLVGPGLKDVTKRRKAEWIMNQILNPLEMTQKDPVCKELLAKYLVQMTNQNVTQDEARSIYEFFRKNDAQ